MIEHKDDIRAAGGILLFSKDGKVLLNKRGGEVPHPGTIGTIGGHLTKGEQPLLGAKREFYEEANYKGPFDNITLLHTQRSENFTYYTFIASTDQTDYDFEPLEDFAHEIEWNKWLNLDDVIGSKNLHPGLRELLDLPGIVEKIRQFIEGIA